MPQVLVVPCEQLTMTQDGYHPHGYGDAQGKVYPRIGDHAGNQ